MDEMLVLDNGDGNEKGFEAFSKNRFMVEMEEQSMSGFDLPICVPVLP